jgi:hypothetical protein
MARLEIQLEAVCIPGAIVASARGEEQAGHITALAARPCCPWLPSLDVEFQLL